MSTYPQVMTYWLRAGESSVGATFASAKIITGKWEDKNELFVDTFGNQVVSKAIVYVSEPLTVGSYLILGNFLTVSDPRTTNAEIIRQTISVGDIRNVCKENKVVL